MNKSLKRMIYSDLYRYTGKISLKNYYIQSIFNVAFKYTKTYRKANYFFSNNKMLYYIYRIKLFKLSKKYGYQIQFSTDISEGLYLGHRGTIIINGNSKIGKNINLATGVTIGQENRGSRVGAPTLGDNVWIGTNAVIVGKITIGSNVLVAPNSFVNFDVPNNSIVLGNPAKIIYDKPNSTDNYIHNKYEKKW